MPEAAEHHVPDDIRKVAADLGGTVGVAARNLVTGDTVLLNADEPFPMASVFKIPVMVEVMRQVDGNTIALDERIILQEDDKSPGSTLIHCHAGLQPTVRDLLYLMITLSDNTATDMLWRRVGIERVNETMRDLGLQSIDCFMPGREFFLLELGMGSDWSGLSGPQIIARWRELDTDPQTRRRVYDRLLDEHRHLTGAEFGRLYDERWGLDGNNDYADSFAVDQALDNPGSPRDMMELLAMIAESRCASPPSCRLMIEVLLRQEWRDKIPAGLPAGTRVGNKTGGVAGTSNDAALFYLPDGAPVSLVVYCKDLDAEQTERAPAAIAAIARAVWTRFGGGA